MKTLLEPEGRGLGVQVGHQWDSFSPSRMNWRDFTFIHIAAEVAHNTGRVELELALFGLWLDITYVYEPDTPFMQRLHDMRRDYQSREAAGENLP